MDRRPDSWQIAALGKRRSPPRRLCRRAGPPSRSARVHDPRSRALGGRGAPTRGPPAADEKPGRSLVRELIGVPSETSTQRSRPRAPRPCNRSRVPESAIMSYRGPDSRGVGGPWRSCDDKAVASPFVPRALKRRTRTITRPGPPHRSVLGTRLRSRGSEDLLGFHQDLLG